tara:strand:+ start:190 stop:492 length:303 start_codon:yes stop_codon:yes gene_type:complete
MNKLHKDLTESGLASKFQMSTITDNLELGKFLGKKVRYKKELLENPSFLRSVGEYALTEVYKIKQVQKDWQGKDVLRGYATVNYKDTFGRCLDVEEIEVA